MNSVFAITSGHPASPQDAPVYVGLGLVVLGIAALRYRRDLYRTYEWVIRYPDHGFIYTLVQLVGPVVAVVAGIGLIASRFVVGP